MVELGFRRRLNRHHIFFKITHVIPLGSIAAGSTLLYRSSKRFSLKVFHVSPSDQCDGCHEQSGCSSTGPRLIEITSCLKDMTGATSFFAFDEHGKISPRFAKELCKVFHLGSWDLIRTTKQGEIINEGLDAFAALAPHGAVHVAEVFFANQKGYIGSHRAFTIQYPSTTYDSRYDSRLIEELAAKVFGRL